MYKEVIYHDLLKYPTDFIVHQANCFCSFGSGIAAQIRKKYPEAYEADRRTQIGSSAKLGTYSWAKTKDKKYIFNMYSQYRYGRDKKHTSYDAMEEALNKIRLVAEKSMKCLEKITVVALPYKIGSNLGGGNWKVIKIIILEIFDKSPVQLVVVCRMKDLDEEDKNRILLKLYKESCDET